MSTAKRCVSSNRRGTRSDRHIKVPEDYLALLRELGIQVPDVFQTISGRTTEALYDPRLFSHPTARETIERLKELRSAIALIREPARHSLAQEPVELSSGLD